MRPLGERGPVVINGVLVKQVAQLDSASKVEIGGAMNTFVPPTKSGEAVVVNSLAADPRAVPNGLLDTVLRSGQPVRPIPEVEGPPADEMATSLLAAMQQGTLPRDKLSSEYSTFATDERIEAAAPRR